MNFTRTTYTTAELKRLLSLAKQLGFQDDIQHWESLLRQRGEL